MTTLDAPQVTPKKDAVTIPDEANVAGAGTEQADPLLDSRMPGLPGGKTVAADTTGQPAIGLEQFPDGQSLLNGLNGNNTETGGMDSNRNKDVQGGSIEHDGRIDNQTDQLKDLMEKLKTQSALDKGIPPLMPEKDQETMRQLNAAVAFGDTQAFAKALERFKGDPAGLKEFMDKYNKVLERAGAGLHVRTEGETAALIGRGDLAFVAHTDGSGSVREVKRYPSGLEVLGDQVHDANPAEVGAELGEEARDNVRLHRILRDGFKVPMPQMEDSTKKKN